MKERRRSEGLQRSTDWADNMSPEEEDEAAGESAEDDDDMNVYCDDGCLRKLSGFPLSKAFATRERPSTDSCE